MNGLHIALTFALVIGFFGILFAFLASLTRLLQRTAKRLDLAATTIVLIREHADLIGPVVQNMNHGLYVVAANLSEVGDLAEVRASRRST
jgi:hypothetical protein